MHPRCHGGIAASRQLRKPACNIALKIQQEQCTSGQGSHTSAENLSRTVFTRLRPRGCFSRRLIVPPRRALDPRVRMFARTGKVLSSRS